MVKCRVCKIESDEIKRCSGCKSVFYCSQRCQKHDRNDHKNVCDLIHDGTYQAIEEDYSHRLEFIKTHLNDSQLYFPNFASEYKEKYTKESEHVKILEFEEFGEILDMAKERTYNLFDDEDPNLHLQKRWGLMSNSLQEFLKGKPRPGDIFENDIMPCGSTVIQCLDDFELKQVEAPLNEPMEENSVAHYQILRNFVSLDRIYEVGKTYVSLGFVDLFQLMFGEYKTTGQSTIRYFAYDRCPIILARSTIIWRMIRMKSVPDESVLQVWFSSCLDNKATKDFKKVCHILLKELVNDEQKDVVELIQLWSESTFPKKYALSNWMTQFNKNVFNFLPLNNLKNKEDRIQYARYLLTGILFVDEANITSGNVSMFLMPEDGKIYQRGMQENLFHTIDIHSRCFNSESSKSMSFIEFTKTLIKKKLQIFRKMIQGDKIEICFNQENISVEDVKLAKEIKQLNAARIEWSNIPDYLERNKFLQFAEKCSKKNTVHDIDVMNWPQKVYGTVWVDYLSDKTWLKTKYFQLKNELIKETKEIWKQERYAYSNHVKFVEPKYLGLYKNIFEQKICTEYIKKYVKYFFKKSDGQPMNVDYDLRKIRMFNPFLISNSAFHLTFSFNDNIDLKSLKID